MAILFQSFVNFVSGFFKGFKDSRFEKWQVEPIGPSIGTSFVGSVKDVIVSNGFVDSTGKSISEKVKKKNTLDL